MDEIITPLDAVRIHRMLRDRKTALEARQKLEMGALNDDIALVEVYIRRFMEAAEIATGSTTFRTAAGTAYESEVEKFQIKDFPVFLKWALGAAPERVALLGNSLGTTLAKAFLKAPRSAIEKAVTEAKAQGDDRPDDEIRASLPRALLDAATIPGVRRSSYKNVIVSRA